MDESFEKTHRPKNLSMGIEDIIKECDTIETTSLKFLCKSMESNISKISLAFGRIGNTYLNPIKFQAGQAFLHGKKRLNAYLKDKYHFHEKQGSKELEKILNDHSTKQTKNQLSFKNLKDDKISLIISSNKRKFGQSFAGSESSALRSPNTSNIPSISVSPKRGGQGARINEMINSMINKQLGILPRKGSVKLKTRIRKKSEPIVEKINILDMEENKEDTYLNPEFRKHNMNVSNRLKVQRIILGKHAADRRANLTEIPFFKPRLSMLKGLPPL